MKSFILITVLCFAIGSCTKEDKTDKPFSGKFVGYFSRSGPAIKPKRSNVTINFTGNEFNGNSSVANYPAICSGTFSVSDSKLMVTNGCVFTADFDGTFIFNGQYTYEVDGNKLYIRRTYGGDVYDEYELEKTE